MSTDDRGSRKEAGGPQSGSEALPLHERVQDLFSEALELAPDTRDAFLDAACGDDAALRAEVESLLRAFSDSEGKLDVSPVRSSLPDVLDDGDAWIGRRIGPYEVVREIGHGGMGAVYEAVRVDEQYRQRVALKLVKRGNRSDLAIRRFRQERQILAQLAHRNIATLLDGGVTPEGQPYFAMEYVEGEPITRYADRTQLTVRQRVELFRQVCNAVQYAHENLVVHRDLKPSNILVDPSGSVKLLDFGIAKLLPRSVAQPDGALTHVGARALTFNYASPEQVRGLPVAPASDIYSLGVILFELLAGKRPFDFDGKLIVEMEQIICEQEPPRLTSVLTPEAVARYGERHVASVRNQLRGDLASIVATALRKEPERRYRSVEQLSADLKRWLMGYPVTAHRASTTYRVRKFVRRNRAEVIAGTLVVLSLVTAVVLTSREARRAERERRTAQEVNAFLNGMLSAVSPESAGREVTVRKVLDAAAQRIDSSLGSQPLVAAELRRVMGRSYAALGLYAPALQHFRQAVAALRAVQGPSSMDVGRATLELAGALEGVGELAEAERMHREAFEILRASADGRDHPDVATAIDNVARLRQQQGDFAQAERLQLEVLEVRRRLFGTVHRDVVTSLNNLSVIYGQQGKYDLAEPLQRQAVEVSRQLHAGPHVQTAAALSALATLLEFKGDSAGADSAYSLSLAMRRDLLGDDHPEYAWTLYNYAAFRMGHGGVDTAITLLRHVVSLRGKTLHDGHPVLPASLQELAKALDKKGEHAEAERLLLESLALRRRTLEPESWLIANSESVLGEHYTLVGRFADAERYLMPSLKKLEKLLGTDHPRVQAARRRVEDLEKARR